MNERIRIIREDKQLSRVAFGQLLGVSGDVINNLERGRVEAKEHIIKLICAEYSVNEEWLRTGNGSMYVEPDTFSLDDFVQKRGATDLELEIVKAYFELDPDIRKAVVSHFKERLSSAASVETEPTVEELEEEYKKSVLNTAQNTGLSASSITEDTERKAVNEN